MSDPTNQYPSIDQSPYGQAPQGAPQGTYELPPVSWTSKLKSREWEAFRVCESGVEA